MGSEKKSENFLTKSVELKTIASDNNNNNNNTLFRTAP